MIGLSPLELIVVFLIFIGIPVGAGLIWLIVRSSTSSSYQTAYPLAVSTKEYRLRELMDLKSKGLITDAEYEQQRSSILESI
jgi:hypothetical protein